MIASFSTALLDRPGLLVAVAATDPVRAADLAARIALAGHRFADSVAQADLVLADAEARTPAGMPLSLSPAQLGAAIRAVAVGLRVALPQRAADPLLTPRELEILVCLGDGMSNKAIARKLGISAHTVKFHLEAVFTKLSAGSRAEAVAKALRRGLINL